MSKNIGKKSSKHLSSKYSQKFLHHVKQSNIDALKNVLKREIHKTTEGPKNLIGNKISHKIAKVSKTLQQSNSETVA